MTKTASRTEVEAKYEVADAATFDALGALEIIGPYRLQARGERNVTDRYLDTEDRSLLHAGFALRRRETEDGGVLIAVKGLGGARGAVHRREEHEIAVADASQPDTWPASRARTLVLRHAGSAPLVELLTIRQWRSLRDVLRSGRRVAELSLDRVEIVAATAQRTHELEIELTPFGSLGDLKELGGHLAPYDLREQPLSKFERALTLLGLEHSTKLAAKPIADKPPAAPRKKKSPREKARPVKGAAAASTHKPEENPPAAPRGRKKKGPGILAGDPMAEAGRKILAFHYERMLDKEAGTRSGADAEDLHDMRVATRRQRAALRIVEPHFRGRTLDPLIDGLRTLGRTLGAVRDLDVLLEAVHRYQKGLAADETTGLQPLIDSWSAKRKTAQAAMLQHLDGHAYTAFKRDYEQFLSKRGEGLRAPRADGVPRPALVAHVLPADVWRHYGAVRAFGPSLPWASAETLHALRIEAKRLRYLLEFFREVLDPHIADAVAVIIALQDHLGELQDAVVTIALVRDFLAGAEAAAQPDVALAAGHYLEGLEARLAELRRSVDGPWNGVSSAEFRATLAQGVVGL